MSIRSTQNRVLFAGGYSTFMNELINRFHKEGYLVFTLTPDLLAQKPDKVFEQYTFHLHGSSVWEVMDSCRPDLVIHMGYHDWRLQDPDTQRQIAAAHVAGVGNLLLCARGGGTGRFLYLSIAEVFGAGTAQARGEEDPPDPDNLAGRAAVQAEALVLAEAGLGGMQAAVLRLPEVVFVPRNLEECTGRVTRLCLEAVTKGQLHIRSQGLHASVHVGDAVQAIYLLAKARVLAHTLYHLPALSLETEYDLARAIARVLARDLPIYEDKEALPGPALLAGERFTREFSFTARTGYRESITRILWRMNGTRSQFMQKPGDRLAPKALLEKLAGLAAQLYPFMEALVAVVLIFLLERVLQGALPTGGLNLYLIYVFVIALLRGRNLGIAAFCLALLARLLGGAWSDGLLPTLGAPPIYLDVIEMFVVGVFTGGLRDRLLLIGEEHSQEVVYLNSQVEDITRINLSNLRLKEYFQELTINSGQSIGWLYEVTSQLDTAEIGEVPFKAINVLSTILEAEHAAMYTVAGDGFLRLFTYTSDRACALGKSINRKNYPDIFPVLGEGRIFVNTGLKSGLPSMASLASDDTGRELYVFFLWDLPFEKMTLYYANLLRVAQALIFQAMNRSMRYLDALAGERKVPGTRLLTKEAFADILGMYRRAHSLGVLDFSLLVVRQRSMELAEWDNVLGGMLRASDLLGLMKKKRLGILLLNTNTREADLVLGRLAAAGIQAEIAGEEAAAEGKAAE